MNENDDLKRVELGELVHDNITDSLPSMPTKREIGAQVDIAIDAILAAGYTKPRQVTTVEELDALPIGSVLILRDAKHQPHPAQKGDYGWRLPFLDDFWDSAKILAGCESAEVVAP